MKYICSLIAVADMKRSRFLYETILGQEVAADFGENVAFKGGFAFVHEIREQPWRQKVFRFYDDDGNIVEIGERLEHVAWRLHREGRPPEEISRITYLPVAKVREAVEQYEH